MAAMRLWRANLPPLRLLAGRPSLAKSISWWGYKKPKPQEQDPEKLAAMVDPGLRLGDYPVLPWRSAQEEEPLGWWDDQDRRNKETPLHEEDDALNMWMYDEIENNGKYTKWEALGQLMIAFTILGGVYYLSMLYDAPSRNPALPRQFPYDNLYVERGGDPNKPHIQSFRDTTIRSAYGGELI